MEIEISNFTVLRRWNRINFRKRNFLNPGFVFLDKTIKKKIFNLKSESVVRILSLLSSTFRQTSSSGKWCYVWDCFASSIWRYGDEEINIKYKWLIDKFGQRAIPFTWKNKKTAFPLEYATEKFKNQISFFDANKMLYKKQSDFIAKHFLRTANKNFDWKDDWWMHAADYFRQKKNFKKFQAEMPDILTPEVEEKINRYIEELNQSQSFFEGHDDIAFTF